MWAFLDVVMELNIPFVSQSIFYTPFGFTDPRVDSQSRVPIRLYTRRDQGEGESLWKRRALSLEPPTVDPRPPGK